MLLINGTNTKCYKRSAVEVGVVGTSEEICKLKVQSEYTCTTDPNRGNLPNPGPNLRNTQKLRSL